MDSRRDRYKSFRKKMYPFRWIIRIIVILLGLYFFYGLPVVVFGSEGYEAPLLSNKSFPDFLVMLSGLSGFLIHYLVFAELISPKVDANACPDIDRYNDRDELRGGKEKTPLLDRILQQQYHTRRLFNISMVIVSKYKLVEKEPGSGVFC